jgi:hypothetical protein
MRGSDPGDIAALSAVPEDLAGLMDARRARPVTRERVFRGSLLSQLREGAWLYTLAVALPSLGAVAALVHKLVTHSHSDLWLGLAGLGMAVHVVTLLSRSSWQRLRGCARCSWLALGDGYVRLGMSFLRPRILFEQIVNVERGDVGRQGWTAHPIGSRVRMRFVIARSWEVVSVAYPAHVDAHGELAAALQHAASQTRRRLGIAEGAPDHEVERAYRDLEARYRAVYGGAEAQETAEEEASG